ncbi:MAG: glycine cleavage system aminomethyltransferase GcvT [Candidatus Omnitrophica bacterium]|nr:glycine cleavage system aminomethyltransferase GcvT [Candidatus Omnitrophota bacterium]MDE2214926.1 glycine cleavage system aminomethyltransferase GcvT [Candidatus Omnitrophota bacterium]MDE2232269.1 glycine cleavage system aminomethyltransferase GcvT [Candidatus Omnitrophota bacterium]
MSVETFFHNTPLVEEHLSLGAKMTGFGGWNMPLQYESILAEWEHNRKTVSLFDCSHMGEFMIKGDPLKNGLDAIVMQPIADMPVHTCRYGAMLNEDGGIIDDLIVYRKGAEDWMIVVNAANIEKDARHIRAHLNAGAHFEDASFKTAKLDLQGPQSRDVLKAFAPGIEQLTYYTFGYFTITGIPCLISRTGYTGELGYEIYCPWEKSKEIWQNILKNGTVKPTGLGVRDVLRIEMCYSLYGHELDEATSPLEAGLDKFIDTQKDFIGRRSLAARDALRTTGYFISASRKSPRAGHQIFDAAGRVLGAVTSGTFSPALGLGIGIGFMAVPRPDTGAEIFFGDDKSKTAAQVVRRPFYKGGSLKA